MTCPGRGVRATLALLAAMSITACGAEISPRADRRSPPNIVLVVVDTLRSDHLSHYGYSRPTAAALDRFRSSATLFERAYATAPWTGPSTISLHTGLSTVRHGSNTHGDSIPGDAATLAELLARAGYRTHGISFNHNVSRKTGYDRGFDVFDDFLEKAIAYPDISQMVAKVDAWLESPAEEPFFLYLHPMNVHGPYRVPAHHRSALLGRAPSPAFRYYDMELMTPLMRDGRVERRRHVTPEILHSLIDQYDIAVHYSMGQIARMFESIRARGLMENTVVVITSDHGEELFDHGGFSHGFSLHREVLQVPLYLHVPGQRAPRTVSRPVSIVDIAPTLLELAGIEAPDRLDGHSLLADAADLPRDRVLIQETAWLERAAGTSVIRGTDHLIDLLHAYDAPDPRVFLYDLEHDPREQHDLAPERAERVAALRQHLDTRRAELEREPALDRPENVLPEMNTETLRALGYVE